MYLIETAKGLLRRHQNQLKQRADNAIINSRGPKLRTFDFDINIPEEQLEYREQFPTTTQGIPSSQLDYREQVPTTPQGIPSLYCDRNDQLANTESEQIERQQLFIELRKEKRQQIVTPRRSERIKKQMRKEP